eukprot:XP_020406441.1 atherin-like [Zea mays]
MARLPWGRSAKPGGRTVMGIDGGAVWPRLAIGQSEQGREESQPSTEPLARPPRPASAPRPPLAPPAVPAPPTPPHASGPPHPRPPVAAPLPARCAPHRPPHQRPRRPARRCPRPADALADLPTGASALPTGAPTPGDPLRPPRPPLLRSSPPSALSFARMHSLLSLYQRSGPHQADCPPPPTVRDHTILFLVVLCYERVADHGSV